MKKGKFDRFIDKVKKVHGDRFDYSKVVYRGAKEKVEIICPYHGVFYQSPNNHLCGHGCPTCSGVNKLTTEKFIEKAQAIHDKKYDYSKVEYKNTRTKVKIVCPIHGEFFQYPTNYLRGHGCKHESRM